MFGLRCRFEIGATISTRNLSSETCQRRDLHRIFWMGCKLYLIILSKKSSKSFEKSNCLEIILHELLFLLYLVLFKLTILFKKLKKYIWYVEYSNKNTFFFLCPFLLSVSSYYIITWKLYLALSEIWTNNCRITRVLFCWLRYYMEHDFLIDIII